MSNDTAQNFKVIVALKSQKDLKVGTVRCAIQINDKVKFTILPQSEGQFFDINDLSLSQPITIMFDVQGTGTRIGDVKINVPPAVYQQKEVELADSFTLTYQSEQGVEERFTGRYYIIILNKGTVKVEKEQFDEPPLEERAHQTFQQQHQARVTDSPTKQFIKSTGERTQERTKKDQSKKLLAETKYDPKPLGGRKSSQKVNNSSTAKKTKGETKQLSKYSSQRSFDQKQPKESHLTPNRQRTEATIPEDSSERMRTPPKQQRQHSPFAKYRGQSNGHLNPTELDAEANYWRGVAGDLKQQVALLEGNNAINTHLVNDLAHSEAKRQDLQLLVRDGVDDGVKFRDEFERKINDLVLENQKLQKKLKAQSDRVLELEHALGEKAQVVRDRDTFITDLERKLRQQDEIKRICNVQQDKLEEQEARAKETQKNFNDQLKNLIASINRLESQYTKLLAEKAQSDANTQDVLGQLQRQLERNAELEATVSVLKSEGEVKGSWELSCQTLRAQNNDLQLQLLDARNRNDQLVHLIEQLRNDNKTLEQRADDSARHFQDKLQALKEVIKGQDLRHAEQEKENKQLQKQILLFREQVQSLQLGAQLSQEVLKQLEAFKKQNQALMADTSQMAQTIEELTDSLHTTNNQILELRAEILHHIQQNDEAESHNNNLKRLILEMRERGVAYIPVSNDSIDQKLASFINNRQDADRQRQLFVREGEGVYQFGSKKIYIKVEQDKILIRSGGGYISIEEFLNLYSQREMESLMRNDPLAALQKNKAALRKRDDMKLVNTLKEDQMSPLKKKGTAFD